MELVGLMLLSSPAVGGRIIMAVFYISGKNGEKEAAAAATKKKKKKKKGWSKNKEADKSREKGNRLRREAEIQMSQEVGEVGRHGFTF